MNQTRRGYLLKAGVVAVGTAGLAGCLGGDDVGSAADTSHECELTEREAVGELPQPTVGDADSTVTVEVFEDFACPACRSFALGDLGRLKDDFAGEDVKFEHYDFPVTPSEWSEPVANAARSIQHEHDDDLFYQFSQAAYENQDDYSWQVIGDIAEDVGADPCRVLSDASAGTYDQVIEANSQEAQQREAPGTPTVFVAGENVDASYDAVSNAIEANQ